MSSRSEYESLDEEIRELLQNYHLRRATIYEPCTQENFKECLIGLHEELELLNIDYVFNPYIDVAEQTLHPQALVKLINAIWSLLQHHKSTAVKADNLIEENHVQEHLNKRLSGVVDKLNDEVNKEKNQSRTCIAMAQKVSDNSDHIVQSLAESKAKLKQLSKQKEALEKRLLNEISRLKSENVKLTDRLRCKSGSFTPCSEACHSTISQLKQQEKRHLATIAKLQRNGEMLLKEVLNMKEKIILNGID